MALLLATAFAAPSVAKEETAACSGLPDAAKFDPVNDLIVAHYDSKPDVDDIHSAAAFATVLRSLPECFRYRVVSGAYGTQQGAYIDVPDFLTLAFGNRWLDAHNDRDVAITTMAAEITDVLNSGGNVWIAEGGQSDFTADVLSAVLRLGTVGEALKDRVHVIQHSTWNEDNTAPAKLAFVKDSADYVRIPDGNTARNGTPDFATDDTSWWPRLTSDPQVGAIWVEAKRIADHANPVSAYINPDVKAGGLDFSDTVELTYIFGFDGSEDHRKFFERFLPPIYDTVPPHITRWLGKPAVLVFSKTASWRHNEGIASANLFFAELAAEKGMGIYTTENGAVFTPETLARFDLVVFNSVTGDTLSPDQQRAFMAWLDDGGAWIGLHGSGDSSNPNGKELHRRLIGAPWIGHPANPEIQQARLVNLAPDHPVMKNVPNEWMHTDEWYSFSAPADEYGMTPLLGIDEQTYQPWNRQYGPTEDLRMGDRPADHPLVWVKCEGDFRTVYSALGHDHTTYRNTAYRALLSNAVNWAMERENPAGCG